VSDNWIALIPNDPHFVPSDDRQQRAVARFTQIAPHADEINLVVSDKPRFFDCGTNFERVVCPSCHQELSFDWWVVKTDEDYSAGFPLNEIRLPCCGAMCSLNDLHYEWPQGFARFGIEAMNPNVGMMSDQLKTEFEEIIGQPLRIIYQHI
jgi:hypothetical protein